MPTRMRPIWLISACLLGVPCRYDGKHCLHRGVVHLAALGQAIPICPEVAGGLSVPRLPAEIVGGDGQDVWAGRARVQQVDGGDVTEAFLRGARYTLRLARRFGAQGAILKSRSPSCGTGQIYDGSFQGRLVPGMGVTAALLCQAGLKLWDEEAAHRLLHGSNGQ